MVRGVLSGIIWGVVVVGGVLAVASLLAPLPATVTPQTEAAAGTEGETDAVAAAAPLASQTDAEVSEPLSSDVVAPSGESQPLVSDTSSAPKPDADTGQSGIVAPRAPQQEGRVTGATDSTVSAEASAGELAEPDADGELSISTNPPQPQAPTQSGDGTFEEAESEQTTALNVTEPTPTPAEEDVTPAAEDVTEDVTETEQSLLKPAGTLVEGNETRKSTRLPSVGSDTATAEETASKPFIINAEPFENVDGKPIMSIVLIDDGAPVNLEVLEDFPYALSMAVSTLDPEAGAKAARYRALGMEVLALIDLPAEAAASDVEVAMQAHLAVSSDFVGIMEGVGDGLQGAKVVSDQVTDVALNDGYGLVFLSKGLNTAQKLAAKEGVPSASVFRDFDGKGQTAVVIRRFLDQAAFKAPQEKGVVMVGRLRDDTISALVLWGLQDRAGTVALAPVSAALKTLE